MRRKISADVDGGLSGVSRCADTGARTPIGVSGIFNLHPYPRKIVEWSLIHILDGNYTKIPVSNVNLLFFTFMTIIQSTILILSLIHTPYVNFTLIHIRPVTRN
jgi:hypothetical protein